MNGRVMAGLAVGVILLCQNVRAQESVPPKKSGATLEQTLAWLKRNFEITFTYGYSTLEKSGDTAIANHYSSTVSRVPLRFEDCDLSWRDGDEVMSVSLKDLDPVSPAVRLHAANNAKFDSDLWELTIFTKDHKSLVKVQGGEAATRSRSDVMLLYDNQEDANKFARVFKHAIELCSQPVRSAAN
jgi:hypothetical protein